MWRWVTRGLVLTCIALCLTPASRAQETFIGSLELPDPGVIQGGMILVKGWVLDPSAITKIELYVDDQFQHRVNSGLPRIDVVEAYPNWPGIHNSSPGFMTGFSASRFSNGPHSVHLKIFTSDGRIQELGRRTINIDNTINQSPFGQTDQPDALGVYNTSGSFPVVGWAADTDGIARIDVRMDDGNMQSAMYGDPRPDVHNTFPDLPSTLYSGFIANVDTTRLVDGVHTLTVHAVDRFGVSRLIGRRTVQVLNNNEANLKPFGRVDEPLRDAVLYGSGCNVVPIIISPPINPRQHITPVRGWALDLGSRVDTGRVSYVELLIDGVRWISTDDCAFSTTFAAYTNCYGLPRYDVQRYYPNYPDAPRSGFMFTLDVGALVALGVRPGHHVMKVRVGDQQQTFAEIPGPQGIPVFFTCVEQDRNFAAFGFIDIPRQFDYVGGNVLLQGWALDENGVVAVEVIVDGNYMGRAEYGFPRPDVAAQNPQLFNAVNSGWRFNLDTTKLSNARHRVTLRVLDAAGATTEFGSIDFYVQNNNQP